VTVPAVWTVAPARTSSHPGEATVDSAGRLEGRVHGSTTLTATYDGLTVSKTVQVINNYGGTWKGTYVIRGCTDTGPIRYCSSDWRVGKIPTLELRLAHRNDLNQVSGTHPHFEGELTGTVGVDGRLTVEGLLKWMGYDYPQVLTESFEIGQWDTNLDGTNGMTGHFSWLYTFHLSPGFGTAHMDNEFVMMTRVSTSRVVPASR
jgi:hypothetical protein